MPSSISANLKLAYLLVLASGLFFIGGWHTVLGLIALQSVLWLHAGLGFGALWRGASRLKWFFLLIIFSYLLIPPEKTLPDFRLDFGWFGIGVYFSGLNHAAMMLGRIFLLVYTSLWVRLSEPSGAFVGALRKLGLSESIAIVIDAGLTLVGDNQNSRSKKGGGSGTGGGGAADETVNTVNPVNKAVGGISVLRTCAKRVSGSWTS